MDSAKQQLVEKLNSSNNVLVTVSRNPSVDQLSALIGLSLLLNKQGKHCAAVFSGKIPSTLEFLKPEDTIEKNTDSLRDFIIALDKSKADKLRYKVENNIVRIFITPYRTSISEKDLDFSQGDFNVDVVVALGVKEQADLDEAITAHGRILHDAVVASVNVTNEGGELGSINWRETSASSLSEIVTDLAQALGDNLLDEQVATALLTGIVSETDRFSNEKTSSQTMSISAVLMAAGANQQLVATKLDQPPSGNNNDNNDKDKDNDEPDSSSDTKDDDKPKPPSGNDDGTLEIDHDSEPEPEKPEEPSAQDEGQPGPGPGPSTPPPDLGDNIELPEPEDEVGDYLTEKASDIEPIQPSPEPIVQGNQSSMGGGPKLITEPPTLGGTLTANSGQSELEPSTDPLSMPKSEKPKLLKRKSSPPPPDKPALPIDDLSTTVPIPPPSEPVQPTDPTTQPPIFLPPSVPATTPLSPPSVPTPQPLAPLDVGLPQSAAMSPAPPAWTPPVPTTSPPTSSPSYEPPSMGGDQDGSQVHIDDDGTLSQLEAAVNSPHVQQDGEDEETPDAASAREQVNKALSAIPSAAPPPIQALHAQPLVDSLHGDDSGLPDPNQDSSTPTNDTSSPPAPASNQTAPPPVPPPIPFEFGKPAT